MRAILTLAVVATALVGQTLSAAATTIIGPVTAEVFIKKPVAEAAKAPATAKRP
jgi:hypothetical protein